MAVFIDDECQEREGAKKEDIGHPSGRTTLPSVCCFSQDAELAGVDELHDRPCRWTEFQPHHV